MEKTHLVHPQLDALTLRVSVRALVGLGEKRQDRQYRGLEPRAQTHGRMLAKPALLTVSFDAGLLASTSQGPKDCTTEVGIYYPRSVVL